MKLLSHRTLNDSANIELKECIAHYAMSCLSPFFSKTKIFTHHHVIRYYLSLQDFASSVVLAIKKLYVFLFTWVQMVVHF